MSFIKKLKNLFSKKVEIYSYKSIDDEKLKDINFSSNVERIELGQNNITCLSQVDFPNSLKVLNLCFNKIVSIDGFDFPINLTELELSHNKIKYLNNANFSKNINILNLSNNQIKSIHNLPLNLHTLDISSNSITSITGVNFPVNLRTLDMSDNKIETLEGIVFPMNISTIDLSYNNIDCMDGVVLPLSLTEFDISFNRIKSLDKVIFPSNITQLYMNHNQITSLDEVIFPKNITILDISYNRIENINNVNFPSMLNNLNLERNTIKSLEKIKLPSNLTSFNISNNGFSFSGKEETDLFPTSLIELNISNNKITFIPIFLVHLVNLVYFNTSGNAIENVHPTVQRFIKNIRDLRNLRINENPIIYNDSQNVHNINVQSSTRDALNKIIKYNQVVFNSKFSEKEISFLSSEYHSYFNFSEREVLLFVENAIETGNYNDETKNELYLLLKESLKEGRKVCSTGRIGRMVNVLSGFDPNIEIITLSENEQISAIITSFMKRKEPKEKVEKELIERGISKKIIDLWLEHY